MKILNSMKLLLVFVATLGYGVMNGYCCSTPVDHCSYTIVFSGDNWQLVDTANANKVIIQSGTGGYLPGMSGARAAICPNTACNAAKHNAFNHYCTKGQSASI